MTPERWLLTFGTFDTPHIGHAAFLKRCELLAPNVVVAIRSDAMVEELRGHPPVFSFKERAALIRKLGYQVHESDEPGTRLIHLLRPDVLAVGSDWAPKELHQRYNVTQNELDDLDITLAFIPYTRGISTTEIKKRLL